MELRELIKQHFSLVDAPEVDSTDSVETEETTQVEFATIKTKDGELTMEYDELSVGKDIFLVDDEGNKVAGPTGEYVLENDKVIRVEDGVIAEVKEAVDAEEEEEKMEESKEEKMEMEKEEDMEDEEEMEEEKKEEMSMSDFLAKLEAMFEDKVAKQDEKMASLEEKISKMAEQPAVEKTIVKSKPKAETFSTTKAFSSDVEARGKAILNQIKNSK